MVTNLASRLMPSTSNGFFESLLLSKCVHRTAAVVKALLVVGELLV